MAQIKPDFYQLKYLDFPFRQNVETALGLQKAVFYEREGDTGNIASQADVLLARHASKSLRKSTVGGYGKQGSLWPKVQPVSVKGRACFQIVSRVFSAAIM